MAMEFRHLRCLIAVAEEGHITRAAAQLGMAQPALSRLIKTIEQEIDLQLFRRVPRGVELTDAGRSLLDGARATFAKSGATFAGRLRATPPGGRCRGWRPFRRERVWRRRTSVMRISDALSKVCSAAESWRTLADTPAV